MASTLETDNIHATRFQLFRSLVSSQTFTDSSDSAWRFNDFGGKSPSTAHAGGSGPAIVFLHGVGGTANMYFHQMLTLSGKGYRCIAAHLPPCPTQRACVTGLDELLSSRVQTAQVHLFGEGLGGFLALLYARRYPRRAASLVLCNGFGSTSHFNFRQHFASCALGWAAGAASPLGSAAFGLLPEFVLRGALLERMPTGMLPKVAAA
jgi:pimeloyl-ACP methyl ester carboxylesterase